MCLTITDNWEEDLRKFINGRKSITIYKIVEKDKTSIYNDYSWKEGINYSSRANSKLTDKKIETCQINKGFHFYNNKEGITKCGRTESKLDICSCLYMYQRLNPRPCLSRPCRRQYRLIKLTIETNNLVAVGKSNDLDSCIATKATWDGKFIEVE